MQTNPLRSVGSHLTPSMALSSPFLSSDPSAGEREGGERGEAEGGGEGEGELEVEVEVSAVEEAEWSEKSTPSRM